MTSRRTVIILYTIPHEDLIPFSCTIFLSKPMVCIFIFKMLWSDYLFSSLRRTKYLFSKSSWSPQDIKWLSHYLFFQTGEEHKICLSSELKPRMYTKQIFVMRAPPFFSARTYLIRLFDTKIMHSTENLFEGNKRRNISTLFFLKFT